MAGLEKPKLSPEEIEFQNAQVTAMQISEDAKLVSPESSGKITDAYAQYTASIAEIHADRSELSPEDYKKTLKDVTDQYVSEIKSITGTTEWSEAKLVEDGKEALAKQWTQSVGDTKSWADAMHKFRVELRKRAEKIRGETQKKETARIRSAQAEWAKDQLATQQNAPQALKEWLQLAA